MRIQDLKTVYICPDHNEKYHKRKQHMEDLLKGLGFTNYSHYKSGTAAYPDCLSQAMIDILTTHMNEPVLILEDDVDFTGISEFNMDNNVDAIYFGLSKSGGSLTQNSHDGYSVYEQWYSDGQVRVKNMLATHAILYISPVYKQVVIDVLRVHMGTKYNSDVLISRLQPKFTVLANKAPSFYQAARFNATDHVEKFTRFVIL